MLHRRRLKYQRVLHQAVDMPNVNVNFVSGKNA